MSNRCIGLWILTFFCSSWSVHAQDFNQIYDSIIRLDEVVVFPFRLSGQLELDASKIKTAPEVSKYSLALPNRYVLPKTQTERLLFEATTGGGIIPLNPILNAINGRTKMLKQRLERDRSYALTQQTAGWAPDSIFTQQWGVPQSRIEEFLYYCEQDPEFIRIARSKDKLALWAYWDRKSTLFLNPNTEQ